MNTGTQLVGAAAEAFLRLDAASVTFGEGPGHHRDTDLLLYETGLADQLAQRNIPFVDLNRDDLVKTKLKVNYSGLGHLWIPRTVLASDFIVSMPLADDPVAADSSLTRLIGLHPVGVDHIREAGRFIGNVDSRAITPLA